MPAVTNAEEAELVVSPQRGMLGARPGEAGYHRPEQAVCSAGEVSERLQFTLASLS